MKSLNPTIEDLNEIGGNAARIFLLDWILILGGATENTRSKAETIAAITAIPLEEVIRYLKSATDEDDE